MYKSTFVTLPKSEELEKIMIGYVDDGKNADRLRQRLKKTPVDFKYNFLMTVRGVRFPTTTVLYRAAERSDLQTVRCMLSKLTPDQRYEAVRIPDNANQTALHAAVYRNHGDITLYLLKNLSSQQRFHIIKLQSKKSENTVLHLAAKNERENLFGMILSSVTPQQMNGLLRIKNRENETVESFSRQEDLHLATTAWPNQATLEARNEIAELQQRNGITKPAKEFYKVPEEIGRVVADVDMCREEHRQLAAKFDQQAHGVDEVNHKIAQLETEKKKQEEEHAQICGISLQQQKELSEANQKIGNLEELFSRQADELADLSEKCEQQTLELTDARNHKEELQVLANKLTEVSEKLSETCEQLTITCYHQTQELNSTNEEVRQLRAHIRNQETALQGITENQHKMEETMRWLMMPVCTDATGNQENEDY